MGGFNYDEIKVYLAKNGAKQLSVLSFGQFWKKTWGR